MCIHPPIRYLLLMIYTGLVHSCSFHFIHVHSFPFIFMFMFIPLQTLEFRDRWDGLQGKVISYGPCQFPTLGFIVERFKVQHIRYLQHRDNTQQRQYTAETQLLLFVNLVYVLTFVISLIYPSYTFSYTFSYTI